MKKILTAVLGLILSFSVLGETAQEILEKVDKNMSPDSLIAKSEMIIHKKEKEYKKIMISYVQGSESLIEFLSPARDKGTKYLKKEDNLWLYLPKANRTQKLSGHMLRKSIMGSDFSYEDQTDKSKYTERYNSKIKEDGNTEYVIELDSKPKIEVTYDKQIMWIDKNTYMIKKAEMYADSGKLLKVMTIDEYEKIGDRYYATRLKMDDKLKKDSYTEVIVSDIKLDENIDSSIFSIKNLERR
jgi:outer membrane lipoprotein-sorting protein